MVVRKRLRSVLVPLALYAVSGAVAAYFLFHAQTGQRGLEAKREIKGQILNLNAELATLKADHHDWERRVSLLQDSSIDRDLLEERVRGQLGWVNPADLEVMIAPDGRGEPR
jgi:cell division protein FtsB